VQRIAKTFSILISNKGTAKSMTTGFSNKQLEIATNIAISWMSDNDYTLSMNKNMYIYIYTVYIYIYFESLVKNNEE